MKKTEPKKYLLWILANILLLLFNFALYRIIFGFSVIDHGEISIFENLIFQFKFSGLVPIFLLHLPFLIIITVALLLLKIRFQIRIAKFVVITLLILIPSVSYFFIDLVVVHNNCIYGGVQYDYGDHCPNTNIDVPCSCTHMDPNWWWWLSGG